MEAKTHWESVYTSNAATEVSWFQEHSRISLELIRRAEVSKDSPIVDVGGGASRLVDDLLAGGFTDLTVLDLSSTALDVAKQRLGPQAALVRWIEADVTTAVLPFQHFALWHDRAVFHFLTGEAGRRRYVEQVHHAVQPGGHVIVATFAPDGPLRCSGLPVMRYSPDALHNEFGSAFELVEHTEETHQTPFGTQQRFIYYYCRKSV